MPIIVPSSLHANNMCPGIINIILCLCIVLAGGSLKAQNSISGPYEYVLDKGKLSTEITDLTHNIISGFTTDEEKARAIYSWIASNISVDVKKLFKGKAGNINSVFNDASLKKVLKKKKGLSSDYSNLFATMCKIAGINAIVVTGINRMNPRLAGRTLKQNDFYWNAICLENKWFIVDSQSGAGIIDQAEKKFIKNFRSEFFLIKPETAIMSFFPGSDENQYLDIRIDRKEMSNLPVIGYGYFKFGVSDHSPSSNLRPDGQKALIIKIKFRENPQKFLLVEGSRKTEIPGFKNDDGFFYLGIDLGTKRNRIVTIAGIQGEEAYDIISYKIN
jgi:hypothetical protein